MRLLDETWSTFLRGAKMETVNIDDVKTRRSQLVDKAAAGEIIRNP